MCDVKINIEGFGEEYSTLIEKSLNKKGYNIVDYEDFDREMFIAKRDYVNAGMGECDDGNFGCTVYEKDGKLIDVDISTPPYPLFQDDGFLNHMTNDSYNVRYKWRTTGSALEKVLEKIKNCE